MPGVFIVIDGTKASGKTTQTELFLKRLQDERVEYLFLKFPRYGHPNAKVAEMYLKGEFGNEAGKLPAELTSLAFAIDRAGAKDEMMRALEAGKVVIADRYVASNLAFQGAKIAEVAKRLVFYALMEHIEYELLKIPRPTLNIVLSLKPELALERLRSRASGFDIHTEDTTFLASVQNVYKELVQRGSEYELIDCAPKDKPLQKEEIHDLVWNLFKSRVSA